MTLNNFVEREGWSLYKIVNLEHFFWYDLTTGGIPLQDGGAKLYLDTDDTIRPYKREVKRLELVESYLKTLKPNVKYLIIPVIIYITLENKIKFTFIPPREAFKISKDVNPEFLIHIFSDIIMEEMRIRNWEVEAEYNKYKSDTYLAIVYTVDNPKNNRRFFKYFRKWRKKFHLKYRDLPIKYFDF